MELWTACYTTLQPAPGVSDGAVPAFVPVTEE